MILVLVGGIYVAAYLPRMAPLSVALVPLILAIALLAANVAMVSRIRPFAWHAFFLVLRWSLLAYVVIAGMIEYVFVFDHTPGRVLLFLTLTLLIFAIDIPVLFAFSVARYQPATAPEAR